jgi:hypothetical protein
VSPFLSFLHLCWKPVRDVFLHDFLDSDLEFMGAIHAFDKCKIGWQETQRLQTAYLRLCLLPQAFAVTL